jgi:hypothetical protein
MTITITLPHYHIVSKIGAGEMAKSIWVVLIRFAA